MPRFISLGLILMLILSAGPAAADQNTGQYVTLPVQTKTLGPETTEAAMFFWYGCGGCFSVAKALAGRGHWPQGASLIRMPALGNPTWRFHGQIYLALEAMGVAPETHLTVFDAFQNKQMRVMERADLPELVKLLALDGTAFLKAFDSPEVAARLAEIDSLSQAYGIRVVPAMVVNGQYRFDLGMVDGPEAFIGLAEELIAKAAAGK